MQLFDLLTVFWISFGVSGLVAWPIFRWLKATVQQKIDPHLESHQVKQGTPTMGGLIILVGALAGLVMPRLFATGEENPLGGAWLTVLVLLIGFGAIGFVDDFVVPRMMAGKRGLGWKQKFALEIAIAAGGLALGEITDPWTLAIGVFLVMFYSNAYNFSDGLDGLAGSLWIGLSAGLLLLANNLVIGSAVASILGGVVVFLFLNAPPAKVFMGDVGSLPLGAVLGFAVLALVQPQVVSGPTDGRGIWVAVCVLSLMMIAELVPVPLQVAYFKLTKGKRLFPRTPIHHSFEVKGWKETRIVWTFALVQLLLSLAAVTLYLNLGGV